jgi:hypothetical protein
MLYIQLKLIKNIKRIANCKTTPSTTSLKVLDKRPKITPHEIQNAGKQRSMKIIGSYTSTKLCG